jgi:hypothetical protein
MERKLKTSRKGRRCKFPDCGRILSIYNDRAYCRIHWNQMSFKRARKLPYRHGA